MSYLFISLSTFYPTHHGPLKNIQSKPIHLNCVGPLLFFILNFKLSIKITQIQIRVNLLPNKSKHNTKPTQTMLLMFQN